ncbi:MAG: hypothetical protein ACI9XU_001900 [Arenicella sp.]|jgi:hypothetical protein
MFDVGGRYLLVDAERGQNSNGSDIQTVGQLSSENVNPPASLRSTQRNRCYWLHRNSVNTSTTSIDTSLFCVILDLNPLMMGLG